MKNTYPVAQVWETQRSRRRSGNTANSHTRRSDTEKITKTSPEFQERKLSSSAQSARGGSVIYLAFPAADMVTGTLLLVDGDWTSL